MTPEILKRIHEIELYTRRLLAGCQLGQQSAAIKGSGYEFDQIREYQQGDDVRFIDWPCTARTGVVMMRQYLEERNRTIMLFVDGSASGNYSTVSPSRYETIATIASVLALSAQRAKDSVGLVIFNDTNQIVVQPSRKTQTARTIMETLFSYRPHGHTAFNSPCDYLLKLKRKDTIAFFISDFIAEDTQKLARLSSLYDTVAIRCLDPREKVLTKIGIMQFEDIETGRAHYLDLRARGKKAQELFFNNQEKLLDSFFNASHIDHLTVTLGRPYIPDLIRFFRRRMLY